MAPRSQGVRDVKALTYQPVGWRNRMEQGQPPTTPDLRPWYYGNWFLFPAFIMGWPVLLEFQVLLLWPVWAILIIRSPWHRGFISGTLAWAMLMSGGFLIMLQLRGPGESAILTGLLVAPGLVLTGVTQAFWMGDKRKLPAELFQPAEASDEAIKPPPSRRERVRRRQRRRSSRPGRSSRHPFRG